MSTELTLQESFERGIPYYGFDDLIPKPELNLRVRAVIDASLAAHTALYDGSLPTVTFSDQYSGEVDKFISLAAASGDPCYFRWDPHHPATDIGLRGLNPEFPGSANAITILHADNLAAEDFAKQGAPNVVIEAMDAVGSLNRYVVAHIVRPMLIELAQAYGHDPSSYLEQFFPQKQSRARTLTRAILYHALSKPTQSIIGSDGAELIIKEHLDQSSFTVDGFQTSPGLEYLQDGRWVEALGKIACFRSGGSDCLEEKTKPTTHRGRMHTEPTVTPEMRAAGVRRIAMPTFVTANGNSVRALRPSSPDTHPVVVLKPEPRNLRVAA